MNSPDFFCDLLAALNVRHTYDYSSRMFASMGFKSLYGLKNLLKQYGVDSEGLRLADKNEICRLPVPFVAPVRAGEWVIVTSADASGVVRYISQGVQETASLPEFNGAWCGVALLMYPSACSGEKDFGKHRLNELIRSARNYALWISLAVLFAYCFISNGLWRSWATVGLTVFNTVGLIVSFMLIQKTLGVHTKAADHFCGVIEKEGCDTVLSTAGSTFLGIFHWSEVGMGYFGVSLVALLAAPSTLPFLALFNACCLPYTVWSVTYQKFKARAWCTLCLTVQLTLWVLFFFYLMAGAWHGLSPLLRPAFFLLPVCYVGAVTGLNKLLPLLKFKTDDN